MYNPFLKLITIFIKDGNKLKSVDMFMQLSILIKLLFSQKKKLVLNEKKELFLDLDFAIREKFKIFFFSFNTNFFFFIFFENLKSNISFVSKIVAGRNQQIPYFILYGKEYSLGFRWFMKILKDKNYYSNFRYFHERLFLEFLNIFLSKGQSFSLRSDFYNSTLRNRSLLRFLKKT